MNARATVDQSDFLVIDKIDKHFRETKAVNEVSFSLPKGQFLTLLGPSGCGKTTTLRSIAGFETIDRGRIIIDGVVVSDPESGINVSPENRNFGMVFQSYAVWPHMTVAENVAYGLHRHKLNRAETRTRVERVLKMVGLSLQIDRPATMLSGGQQQRVALARAIVYEPKILLFDEPLSNLDAKLRERMRIELRRLQAELGITSVYVTHDQEEAMVVSDTVIVMNLGEIQQIGPPQEIYDRPANRFVADFIGAANIFDGKVREVDKGRGLALVDTDIGSGGAPILATCYRDLKAGDKAAICVRHENVALADRNGAKADGVNVLPGRVAQRINMGSYVDYSVEVHGAEFRLRTTRAVEVPEGHDAAVTFRKEHCLAVPA